MNARPLRSEDCAWFLISSEDKDVQGTFGVISFGITGLHVKWQNRS